MNDQVKLASRHWQKLLRFSVRGVILLVFVIAAALGWIVHQAHLQRDAVAVVKRAGGHVTYDIDLGKQVSSSNKLSAWRRWIGDYIGVDFVSRVIYVDIDVTPSNNDAARRLALARLHDFVQLKTMNFAGECVRDGDLDGTKVTDAGAKDLEHALPNLTIER